MGYSTFREQVGKWGDLRSLARYRDEVLRPHPRLRHLFFEVTSHCNEYCRHCGSRCGDYVAENPLTDDEIRHVMDTVKEDFAGRLPMLCITGGEPLLRDGLCDLMAYAAGKGFSWGMTSNVTLITPDVARDLRESGMRTISVSLDGLRDDHDWFRQVPGCYDEAIAGIHALVDEARKGGIQHVQVTSVITKRTIGTLDAMYDEIAKLGVRSWRVINIEPIGRAKEQPELLLEPKDYRHLMDFIVSKRHAGPMTVCYGCSHYLGVDLEGRTRDWDFICSAGIMTASITAGGDIVSCLDVERRPELVEGNVRRDRFGDVWRDGFMRYRTDWRKVGKCARCALWKVCAGDSFHSWNFDEMRPELCMKGILF